MSWIFESINKSKKMKDHYKLHDINIFIKDQLPESILLIGVDMIYIGQFKQLIDREITAVFEDGAIYLTNEQDDDRDMIDDIIHEIAHSIENIYANVIYGDNEISIEFLKKKKKMID